MAGNGHDILDPAALEAVIGTPMDHVRAKLATELNGAMQTFIGRSPLLLVSTIDEQGNIDISPKGDPAGFVEVRSPHCLLVPERPGNRLTFGFHNILRNGRIGLMFIAHNQRETLRVKGTATLHNDPETLDRMQVNGKPALLYTRVTIAACFFHCGKALIRSHMWEPEHWDAQTRSIAARQFTSHPPQDDEATLRTEALLDSAYRNELY